MNKNRYSRVLQQMKAAGLSQIVVTEPASVYYLTGQWIEPLERMLALYISEARCVLVANHLFVAVADPDFTLLEYSDAEDPVSQLAAVVQPGKLGIDKFWPSQFLIRLMGLRQDIAPVIGSPMVDLPRTCKQEDEVALLRAASLVNDQVMATAISSLRVGLTELELARIIADAYDKEGADCEGGFILTCFSAGCAEPHHVPSARRLAEGDCVLIDIGKPVNRYHSDMTRTVFFGSAGEEERKVYDLVRRANQAGIDMVRPGVLLSDIDKACRDVIEEAGYGKYFTHRTGHGIGLSGHEPPDVSSVSPVVAEPGMVFSIEPGIYLAERFGVRIEDLVVVTDSGVEVLNHYPKTLQVVAI